MTREEKIEQMVCWEMTYAISPEYWPKDACYVWYYSLSKRSFAKQWNLMSGLMAETENHNLSDKEIKDLGKLHALETEK